MGWGERVTAHILTVGDELLSGDTVNTNQAFLGARCRRLGVDVSQAVCVPDREASIVAALQNAAETADVCLVCGGLGPTIDDMTTVAVARAAGADLERDPDELEVIESKFRAFGRPMGDLNRKQADRPVGAQWLANPIGSASGLLLDLGGCSTFVMPGVPRELHLMMEDQVEPRLRERFDLQPRPRRVYKTIGMGESTVALRVDGVVERMGESAPQAGSVLLHYRPAMPEVTLVLEATMDAGGGPCSADALATFDLPIREALAPALYGVGEAGLAERLVRALSQAGLRLGLAESCTGGGAAAMVTAIPGASACLQGGIVAYDNRIKQSALGVAEGDLLDHGAVSEAVARAMAEGARRVLGSDLAASITGIAGPDGGTPDKPVGTVHIAVCDERGTVHKRLLLRQNRATIQRSAALWALKLVWDRLVERGMAAIEALD
jgi:nicotinamide-nucleotide amidase